MLKFSTLDFQGKTVAKFIIRSPFLSMQNNTTVKQQINHGTIIRVCHLYSFTFPVLFTENNKLLNEGKEDFLKIWLFQRIALYQER